jgi:hypothetical protein
MCFLGKTSVFKTAHCWHDHKFAKQAMVKVIRKVNAKNERKEKLEEVNDNPIQTNDAENAALPAPAPEKIEEEENDVEIDFDSTNDLTIPGNRLFFKAFALVVQVFQTMCLIALCLPDGTNINDSQAFQVKIGETFVFFSLVCTNPTELSSGIRREVRLVDNLLFDANEIYELLPYEGKKYPLLRLIVSLALSFVLAISFLFTFLLCDIMPQLYSNCTVLDMIIRFISNFLEVANLGLSTVACVILVAKQKTLIEILFNYAGIMVVNSLDNQMAGLFQGNKPKVNKIAMKLDQQYIDCLEASCEMGAAVLTGVIVVWVYLTTGAGYTVKGNDDYDDAQ